MEILIIWLLCGAVAAVIGARKGEGCAAFIIGFIFGPFGILFALISKGNRIKCPHCKELINKDAEICMHCHSPLKEAGIAPEKNENLLESPQIPPPPKPEPTIRIAKNGEDWGDLPQTKVAEMIKDGTLTLEDYYFDIPTGKWAELKWNLDVRKQ